LSYGRD